MTEQRNKPDEIPQRPRHVKLSTPEVRASADPPAAASEGQLAGNNEIIERQREKIAQLQRELDEARQEIKVLESEAEEILSVLNRMKEALGWKLVKKFRRAKVALLPSGTIRRRLYDRFLAKIKTSRSESRSFSHSTIQEVGAALPLPGEDFYRADMAVLQAPHTLEVGKAGTAKVGVTNLSRYRWLAAGRESDGQGSVRLSYHWYDTSGNVVQWEGEHTRLPEDLEPQKSVHVGIRILAPFDPGTYTLEITLIHIGVAWFEQKGSTPLRIPLQVERSARNLPPLPSCSIIVPVFNRAVLTKFCLLGIERSICSDQLQHEVIVVDNGSTDITSDLLRSWSDSRLYARVISLGRNLGFARACNEGARVARGHYLVFLNNDTLPTPGWLERMVRLAEGEPGAGIVGSKLLYPDGRIQHVGVAFGADMNPTHIYRGFSSKIRPAKESRAYQAVTGACLLIKREIYNLVGGMDEIYRNSFEDLDLCLKVRELGYRVWICAHSTVYHFESMTEGRHAHEFRNKGFFKARWAQKIEIDLDRWHALDHLVEDPTDYEPPERYEPGDRFLRALWRRVYSCDIPEV